MKKSLTPSPQTLINLLAPSSKPWKHIGGSSLSTQTSPNEEPPSQKYLYTFPSFLITTGSRVFNRDWSSAMMGRWKLESGETSKELERENALNEMLENLGLARKLGNWRGRVVR
uniref:Uncharacterized protein n=1 Tax=Opuntia streptacantha TaxID=393608 RepID=A0A7C9A350_OPUST